MEVLPKIEEWHDRLFAAERVEKVERLILYAACVGFAIHLALITLAKFGGVSGAMFDLAGETYFSALYTPFSFILLFEVLAMVLALPGSFSAALGIQFQIVALIFIRRIFGDIGRLGGELTWDLNHPALVNLGADMVGALVLFFLTTAFLHASKRINPGHRGESEVVPFVQLKKLVTLGLAAILVALAGWSVIHTGIGLWDHMYGTAPFPSLDFVFYEDMFTVMIFADVFVLLASYRYSNDFELIFRNAGFVVSTVLVRLAFTAPRPWDIAVCSLAIAFAVILYLIFGYYLEIRAGEVTEDAPPSI